MEKRTRVLLADANEEFRILLRQLLEETGEFEVAASTGDGPMVMELVRRTKPELILMDVVLPGWTWYCRGWMASASCASWQRSREKGR